MTLTKMQSGTQEANGFSMPTLRLPATMAWAERVVEGRNWLKAFNPDWASLQFVPFGFNRKGLCFGLGEYCAEMNPTATWHIMFHELWLGMGENASAKHRFWGAFQRRIVLNLVKRLRPRVVNTQAEPYQSALQREHIQSSLLPLFSNIPFVEGDAWASVLEPLISRELKATNHRNELYLAGVFGAVHPEWSAETAVETVLPLVKSAGKKLVLVFLGRNNLEPTALEKLKASLKSRASLVIAGEQPDRVISQILQGLDLGMATSPRQIIQKSGTVAAMLEHGLPVLVTRDDWHLRGRQASAIPELPGRLFSAEQFSRLHHLPQRVAPGKDESGVKQVADRMLAAMKTARLESPVMAS